MIHKGDTVLISIPTYWPGLLTVGASDPNQTLQSRLQQAGLTVLKVDAGALPFIGGSLRARANLVVIVQPYSSDYANVQDVANLVAGAAYASGFDINAGASGQVVGYANPTAGQPSSGGYQQVQQAPPADPNANKSVFDDIAQAFGVSKTTAEIGVIGAAAAIVLVLIKTR